MCNQKTMSKYHFIAVGGTVMSQLAVSLKKQGHEITGSDDAIYGASLQTLSENGLLPAYEGWNPDVINSDIDTVILGMHAKKNNPELIKAQQLHLPIVSYPEFLFEKSTNKTRVVIAGSHGKTTITSMVLHALQYHGIETDYLVGGRVPGVENSFNLTSHNDFILIEGDEYASSALDAQPKIAHYHPNIALMSGIAWDHINVYPNQESYVEVFKNFIKSITPGGVLVYNEEDTVLKQLVDEAENYFRKFPYSLPEHSVNNGTTYLHTEMGELPLKIFGEHNLRNLEGAKYICHQLGILEEDFYEAMMNFEGAELRLQKISENPIIYRDYAHAPTKVKAASDAIQKQFPHSETVGILELHTYSSLNSEFIPQYRDSLNTFASAVVYYDAKVVEAKGMKILSDDDLKIAFNNPQLLILHNVSELQNFWNNLDKTNKIVLIMSSGQFGGFNFLK